MLGHTENTVPFLVITVVTPLVGYVYRYNPEGSNANGQAANIYQWKKTVLKQVSPGDFKIVSYHN